MAKLIAGIETVRALQEECEYGFSMEIRQIAQIVRHDKGKPIVINRRADADQVIGSKIQWSIKPDLSQIWRVPGIFQPASYGLGD